jgi:predicted negative regulator of RcsB-dependent stress response
VDEYLTDKEQLDRLRQWWRENGWFLLGGVALGLLALYGYNQYFAHLDRRSEEAAALYQSLQEATTGNDAARAGTLLEQLRAEHPDHAYTQQGMMLVARTELVTAPEQAAEKLRTIMETSTDPELALIARIRLARVLAYREQYQEALALLDVQDPGDFGAFINEIKGDVHVALGDTVAARTAYLEAFVAPGGELLDRNLLQMKLSDLETATASETPALPPVDPAVVPPAAPLEAAPAAGEAPGDGA